jgi:hypothetical protein
MGKLWKIGKHGKSETVIFNGIKWRRYPESKRRDLRVYFYSQNGKTLHRAVWESVNGPVPLGYHVHHVNDDPLDNRPENLAAIPAADHLRGHASDPERVAVSRRNIELARPFAAAWHGSDEGRAWHSEHAKRIAATREKHECVCIVCGDGFWSKARTAKVCGANCHAKRRRDSGADDAEFTCPECGVKFIRNRYARPKHCSRSCATRRANRARAARLQHHG